MRRLLIASLLAVASASAGCAPAPAPRSPAPDAPREAVAGGEQVAAAGPMSADEEEPETMPMAAAVPAAKGAPIRCEPGGASSPARVGQEEFARRTGVEAAKFSELPLQAATPLEACGARAALAALMRLTCDDGSMPFGTDTGAAQSAKRAEARGGGRCGSEIAVYDVACPEKTYVVHVDARFCGPTTAWD